MEDIFFSKPTNKFKAKGYIWIQLYQDSTKHYRDKHIRRPTTRNDPEHQIQGTASDAGESPKQSCQAIKDEPITWILVIFASLNDSKVNIYIYIYIYIYTLRMYGG